MDDFRVKKASEILKRFFDDETIQEASRFEAFRSTWKQIVGQRLADHSKPKSIMHRTLLITADHAGWIQLLQMDQARILERVSKHYPELEITSLAFTVALGEDREKKNNAENSTPAIPLKSESNAEPGRDQSSPLSTLQTSCAPNAEFPKPLGEIFTRMRRNDAQSTREKGN